MIQWRWIVYNQQDADALQTLGGDGAAGGRSAK